MTLATMAANQSATVKTLKYVQNEMQMHSLHLDELRSQAAGSDPCKTIAGEGNEESRRIEREKAREEAPQISPESP